MIVAACRLVNAPENSGFGPRGGFQRGHQGKYPDGEQDRRRKRAEKSQPRQQSDDEIGGNNGPRGERGGFVKIVDGALVEGKTAFDHCLRVQRERGEQQ